MERDLLQITQTLRGPDRPDDRLGCKRLFPLLPADAPTGKSNNLLYHVSRFGRRQQEAKLVILVGRM